MIQRLQPIHSTVATIEFLVPRAVLLPRATSKMSGFAPPGDRTPPLFSMEFTIARWFTDGLYNIYLRAMKSYTWNFLIFLFLDAPGHVQYVGLEVIRYKCRLPW